MRDTLVPFSRLRGKVPAGRMGDARAEDSRWRINSFRATVAGDGFRAPAALNSFRAPAAPESLSLACPRESNQRERHPAWRFSPARGRKDRAAWLGFSTARPYADEKGSASCRSPCGPGSHAALAAQGRGSVASQHAGDRRFGGTDCASRSTTLLIWVPCAAVRRGRQAAPAGVDMDVDAFSSGQESGRKARPRLTDLPGGTPGKRQAGWLLFWLLFSGHAEKSDSGAAGARKLLLPLGQARESDSGAAGARKLLLPLGQARASHSRAARAPAAVGVGAARYATDIRRVTVFRRAFKTRCGWPLTGIHAVLAECGCWLRTDHG